MVIHMCSGGGTRIHHRSQCDVGTYLHCRRVSPFRLSHDVSAVLIISVPRFRIKEENMVI